MKRSRKTPCFGCADRRVVNVLANSDQKEWNQCIVEPRFRWVERCPVCYPGTLPGAEKGVSTPNKRCFRGWMSRYRLRDEKRPDWTPVYLLHPPGVYSPDAAQARRFWWRLALGEPWVRLLTPDVGGRNATWEITADDVEWREPAYRVWARRCAPWLRENGIPLPAGPFVLSGQMVGSSELPPDFAFPYTVHEMLFLASSMATVIESPRVQFSHESDSGDFIFRIYDSPKEPETYRRQVCAGAREGGV